MRLVFEGTESEIVALCARIGAIAATGEKPAIADKSGFMSDVAKPTLSRKMYGFNEACDVVRHGGFVCFKSRPTSGRDFTCIVRQDPDTCLAQCFVNGEWRNTTPTAPFGALSGHHTWTDGDWFDVADPTEAKS